MKNNRIIDVSASEFRAILPGMSILVDGVFREVTGVDPIEFIPDLGERRFIRLRGEPLNFLIFPRD